MSEKTVASSATAGSHRQRPSRLQRQAPASLQIASPPPSWNTVIPLLSPLAASPRSPELIHRPPAAAAEEARSPEAPWVEQDRKPVVFNTWQHPAAPFYYEPARRKLSFVPA